MNRKKLVLLAIALVVLVTVTILATSVKKNSETGSAQITLQFADTKNIKATLDDQPFTIKDLDANYTLSSGDHTLHVTKTGYDDFSTSFTITTGQNIYITVAPALSQKNQQAVTQTAPAVNTAYEGWTITGTHFFSNNMWAVLDLEGEGQLLGYAIVRFDTTTSTWVTVVEPSSSFTTKILTDNHAPDDLLAYLSSNDIIVDIE